MTVVRTGGPKRPMAESPDAPRDDRAGNPAPVSTQPPDAGPSAAPDSCAGASRTWAPAIPLSSKGTAPIAVDRDGRIGLVASPGDESAAVVALAGTGSLEPFASVADVAVLSAVGTRLVALHAACNQSVPTEEGQRGLLKIRAAALALLESAAVRAGQLGKTKLQGELVQALARAIAAEPSRELRDFAFASLDRGSRAKKLPRVGAAAEAVYPSRPPYEKWLADGVIRVHAIVDSGLETAAGEMDDLARRLGMERTENPDRSVTFRLAARDGRPALELTVVRSVELGGINAHAPSKLLEKMDDPSVDVVLFCGHSSYGHRVERALDGLLSTGDGKVLVLASCVSANGIESLARRLPDAQVVGTTASSYDPIDFPAIERMFRGFLKKEDWKTIGAGVREAVRGGVKELSVESQKKVDPATHYFFPDTRQVAEQRVDRDRDGVPDGRDARFNAVAAGAPGPVGGFDPVDPGRPAVELDARAASAALRELETVLRYEKMLPPAVEKGLPWSPGAVEGGPVFAAGPHERNAFRFEVDPKRGKLVVRLSSQFAHASPRELGRMLAVEAGLWFGERAGLNAAGRTALALSMLERVIKHRGDYGREPGVLKEEWAEEALLLARYHLDEASFAALKEATGAPEDFLPEHFRKVEAFVRAHPALTRAADRPPDRVGEPLRVPPGARVEAGPIDRAALSSLLARMGVAGTLAGVGPAAREDQGASTLLATVRGPDGRARAVALGVGADGAVSSATALTIDLERVKEQAARACLADLSPASFQDDENLPFFGATGFGRAGLEEAFDRERGAGASVAGALAGALREARRLLPPGSSLPQGLSAFEHLAEVGLVDPKELATVAGTERRLFPSGLGSTAEQRFVMWVAAQPGVDRRALWADYLAALSRPDGSGDRLAALKAVVRHLPRSLPPAAAAGCDLPSLALSGLLEPGEAAELAKAVLGRTGLAPAHFVAGALAAGIPAWASRSAQAAQAAEEAGAQAAGSGARAGDVAVEVLEAIAAAGGRDAVPKIDPRVWVSLGLIDDAEARRVEERLKALTAA